MDEIHEMEECARRVGETRKIIDDFLSGRTSENEAGKRLYEHLVASKMQEPADM